MCGICFHNIYNFLDSLKNLVALHVIHNV